jgi:hypothetical protein
MGLSIAYQLRLPAATSAEEVHAILTRAAEHALSLGCPEVRGPLTPDVENQIGYERRKSAIGRLFWVPPSAGWLVRADIGEGCESLRLALFRHPMHVQYDPMELIETKLPTDWHYDGWCKTGYAANVSWEHFLACHQRALALLRFLRRQGVKVSIQDEGGYYPHKNETGLRRWMGLPVPPPATPPLPRRKRSRRPLALAQPSAEPVTQRRRPEAGFKAGRFDPSELLLQEGFPFTG